MRVVFPGTFDPITLGHEGLVRRVASIFDEVVVGVAAGVHKNAFFPLEERVEMTTRAFAEIDNVRVAAFGGLLANFMREQGSRIIIRGVRVVADFEFESQLSDINKNLNRELETIFFLPDRDYIYLSSSIVREVARLGGVVTPFVSQYVAGRLLEKLRAEPSDDGA